MASFLIQIIEHWTKHCLGLLFLPRKKTKDSWTRILFNSSMMSSRSPGSFNCSLIPFFMCVSVFFHSDYKMSVVAPGFKSESKAGRRGKKGDCSSYQWGLSFAKTKQYFPPPNERLGNKIPGHSESSSWSNAKTNKKERGKSKSLVGMGEYHIYWEKKEIIELLNIY